MTVTRNNPGRKKTKRSLFRPGLKPKPRIVNVDLTNYEGRLVTSDLPLRQPSKEILKETAASEIAHRIIRIFFIALIAAFIISILPLIPLLFFATTEQMTDKMIPTMGNILEPIKLIGTLFSPLLAFILGYYFSTSSSEQNKNKSN